MEVRMYLFACLLVTSADIYIHNPRGSNNRLDESGRARENANRMFDSQNNNRGGYNVGGLYYYAGSKLDIEWTNQHSCGHANNHCELVLQYMCGDTVRDGTTTRTIPEKYVQCENSDCNSDMRYGMHEDYDYYQQCKTRKRNHGLYLIDQNLRGRTARFTRQNPGGMRRGYECPEERDYYPYWHPTPWRDIAVMTNDATRCPYYQAESENVKGRWSCVLPRATLLTNVDKGIQLPNTRQACEEFRWPRNDPDGARARWIQAPPAGGGPPECRETKFSRDNHLGNGLGGYPNTYTWTVPDMRHEQCVLRIRYNISTADYEAWQGANATHNDSNQQTRLDLSEHFRFRDRDAAEQRGYRLRNNPKVQVFPGLPKVTWRLAVNTAQYGRTFQDRSHTFAIRQRPPDVADTTVYNVNVRGKRGNIVQVYPAVEYDFVPNTLRLGLGDHIHFQWTGSNSNPHNNDGQGRAGSDRSNVVLQRVQAYPEGTAASSDKFGHWGRSYPDHVTNTSLLGLSAQDRINLALLSPRRGDMSELDDAATYFDLGPRKVTMTGTFHYMCTRNNNFSNRSQKGRLLCKDSKVVSAFIGWNGGKVSSVVGDERLAVNVARGIFSQMQNVQVEQLSHAQAEQLMEQKGRKNPVGGSYSSLFAVIKPEVRLVAADGGAFTVQLSVTDSGSRVYRTTTDFASWTRVSDVRVDRGVALFDVAEGGVYVAVAHDNTGAIIGAVVATLLLVAVIGGGVLVYRKCQRGVTNRWIRSWQRRV